MTDLSDPDQVKARDEKVKRKRERRIDNMYWLMNDKRGREIIFDLLAFCGIGRSAFAQNALVMAHNTGLQSVGLNLFGEITTPELMPLYQKMIQENSNVAND